MRRKHAANLAHVLYCGMLGIPEGDKLDFSALESPMELFRGDSFSLASLLLSGDTGLFKKSHVHPRAFNR